MKLEQLNEKKHHDENKDLNKAPAPGKLGDLISSAQAAKMLGVTMGRIRQFVMDGRLKSYQPEKGRRDHMFKISEIRAFAKKEREITGRPPEGKKKKTVKESVVTKALSFKNGNKLNPGDSVFCIIESIHNDKFMLTDEDGNKIGVMPYDKASEHLTGF